MFNVRTGVTESQRTRPTRGHIVHLYYRLMKVFGSQRYTDGGRRPALAAPRRGAPSGSAPRGAHGGPRRSPGLKAGDGGSTQPYSCKNREKSVYQRSHMRPETGSCRTKAVIKSSVQSWRLVEEEVLAQAAALGYQHKVWRDNYTSGCRSNGA